MANKLECDKILHKILREGGPGADWASCLTIAAELKLLPPESGMGVHVLRQKKTRQVEFTGLL
jgi:hypothetical protein